MKILRASWVLPVSAPPISDGVVAIEGSRIAAVGPASQVQAGPGDTVKSLEGYALLPAFVNAHAHLGLSHLLGKVPYEGSFTGWLDRIRKALVLSSRPRIRHSLRKGLKQAAHTGTGLVADILVKGIRHPASGIGHRASAQVIPFFEILGWSPAVCERGTELAKRFIARQAGRPFGLSPHAPYSTSPVLYRWAAEMSRRCGCPLGTHAAETRDEIEFLKTGRGPLRDFLTSLGIDLGDWQPPGLSPVQYLATLDVLGPRTLLFHGNYLDEEDIEAIARAGASVVFCPRSHSFFGHEHHPLPRLLRAGVRVCLGTDSLASNWSLDMRAEMNRVRETFPMIEPSEVLPLATRASAEAVGLGHRLGTIEPGKESALVAWKLPEAGDPYSFLFGDGECLIV